MSIQEVQLLHSDHNDDILSYEMLSTDTDTKLYNVSEMTYCVLSGT